MPETYSDQFGLYGLMAEFAEPEELLAAAERSYMEGYRKMDAYTPVPIEGLSEAIGFTKNFVSPAVLTGGVLGCIGGFSLLWWITVVAYAHNVAGRPMNSWPAYIPVTFECTVLLASLTAFVGMFMMNGLPEPYHPVFNNPRFAERASIDRYFLCIEAKDPLFNLNKTKTFLSDLNPLEVAEIEK